MFVPLVSVILPVHNAGQFLTEALRSLQQQTCRNFECLCLDDGSTDDSHDILARFAATDFRFRVLSQRHQGITRTLNTGLQQARGIFVARMDADDISEPTRFEQQVGFLIENPQVVAVGSSFTLIDTVGVSLGHVSLPQSHTEIDAAHLSGRGGLAHPATMFRAPILRSVGGYREKFPVAQDKDLWLRLAECGELANLPEPLLRYRLHSGSVSFEKTTAQIQAVEQAVKDACERRGCKLPRNLYTNLARYQHEQRQPFAWKLSRTASGAGYSRTAFRYACAYWKSSPASLHAGMWWLRSLAACLFSPARRSPIR